MQHALPPRTSLAYVCAAAGCQGEGKKKWMSRLAGSQCICLLSFTPPQSRWNLAIFKSDVCMCSHRSALPCEKKGKKTKTEILKIPVFHKQTFLLQLMSCHSFCLASFLYFKEVKQKPVIIFSQMRPADEEETRALQELPHWITPAFSPVQCFVYSHAHSLVAALNTLEDLGKCLVLQPEIGCANVKQSSQAESTSVGGTQ